MKALLWGSAAMVVRHLVSLLVGVLTVGLVARRLGAEGLGAWALLGVVGFLVGLCDLGLSVGVSRAVLGGERERALRAAERAWLVVLVLGVPLGGGAVLWALRELSRMGVSWGPSRLLVSGALVLLGGLAGALAMPLRSLLGPMGRLGSVSAARALGAGAQALVLVPGFWLWRGLEVPTGAFAAGALVELGVLVWGARQVAPDLRFVPRAAALGGLRGALREGAAVLVINLSVVAALRVDAAVLVAVASLPAIAAYGVAARAVDQLFGLVKQVSAALQPRMAVRDERAGVLRLGAWVQPPLVIGAVGALWFCGEPLLRLWVGGVLDDGAFRLALGILGVAAVFAAFSEVANAWLLAAAPSPWSSAFAIGVGCSVNLLFSVVGRHAWGVAAVAGGTLLGNTLAALLAWRLASRRLGWGWRQLAGAAAPALASAVAVALVGPGAQGLARGGPGAAAVAGAAVGVVALLAAGATGWFLRAETPLPAEAPCASGS